MTQKKKLIVGQELIFVPCDPVNGMREESETVVVAKSGLKKVTFKTKDGKLHQNNLSKDNSFYICQCIENWRIVGYLYLNEEDIALEKEFESNTSYEELNKLTVEEKKQIVSLIKLFNKNKKVQ